MIGLAVYIGVGIGRTGSAIVEHGERPSSALEALDMLAATLLWPLSLMRRWF